MKAAVMVMVMVSGETAQTPPEGVTVNPDGCTLVLLLLTCSGSSICVSIHRNGCAAISVNVTVSVGGDIVVLLKARFAMLLETTGFTISAIGSAKGGAGWPSGIGTGELLSIIGWVSIIVSGNPVSVWLKSVARITLWPLI